MAYFSNSDEGLDFEARICSRCVHREKDEGAVCPVMGAHIAYNGMAGPRGILDMLIPPRVGDADWYCTMFIEAPGQVPWEGP